MGMRLLDTIVLEKDFPDRGLMRGDIGAIVELYESDSFEVEFVKGSGKTQALITLKEADVRSIGDSDIIAVRSLKAA